MDKQELLRRLTNGILLLKFVKKDGTLREMSATLLPNLIPKVSGTSNHPEHIIVVWDTVKKGWRSIDITNETLEVTGEVHV